MHAQTRVIFHPGMRCFYDTEDKKKLKGITDKLRSTFYPSYRFANAPKGDSSGHPGVRAGAGRSRGRLVDRQVAAAVMGAKVRNPHPFTKLAITALKKSGLVPVASQVVVYDLEAGIATAVDVVVRDVDGSLATLELKCTSDSRFKSACGKMLGALAAWDDSIENQQIMQVQMTRVLYEKTYKTRARAYILRVNAGGAYLTKVPRAADTPAAYAQLISSTEQPRKTRRPKSRAPRRQPTGLARARGAPKA